MKNTTPFNYFNKKASMIFLVIFTANVIFANNGIGLQVQSPCAPLADEEIQYRIKTEAKLRGVLDLLHEGPFLDNDVMEKFDLFLTLPEDEEGVSCSYDFRATVKPGGDDKSDLKNEWMVPCFFYSKDVVREYDAVILPNKDITMRMIGRQQSLRQKEDPVGKIPDDKSFQLGDMEKRLISEVAEGFFTAKSEAGVSLMTQDRVVWKYFFDAQIDELAKLGATRKEAKKEIKKKMTLMQRVSILKANEVLELMSGSNLKHAEAAILARQLREWRDYHDLLTPEVHVKLISLKSKARKTISLPANISILAGELIYNNDCRVTLHDSQIESVFHICDGISMDKPDIIGFSLPIGSLAECREIMKYLDKIRFKGRVIFGNVQATYDTEYLLEEFPGAIIVRGEGEKAIVDLTEAIASGSGLGNLKNVVYVENGRLCRGLVQPPDLSELQLPYYGDILGCVAKKNGIINLRGSRGCPWLECSFCSGAEPYGWMVKEQVKNGGSKRSKKWRTISIDKIILAMRHLAFYASAHGENIDRIMFTDADGLIGIEYADKLARAIIDNGLDYFKWTMSTRANFLYSEKDDPSARTRRLNTVQLLKKAGCDGLFVGLETGSEAQRKRYKKWATIKEAEEAAVIMHKNGILRVITTGWIFIDPLMEDISELKENIGFIKRVSERISKKSDMYEMAQYIGGPVNALTVRDGSEYLNMVKNKEKEIGRKLLGELDHNTMIYDCEYVDQRIGHIAEILTRFYQEWIVILAGQWNRHRSGTNTADDTEVVSAYHRLTVQLAERLIEVYEAAGDKGEMEKAYKHFNGELKKELIKKNVIHETGPFLHDLCSIEGAAANFKDKLLSVLSSRKVVLVFDNKLCAPNSNVIFGVIEELLKLKKDPVYERILSNLIVINATSNNILRQLNDISGEDAEIFMFMRNVERNKMARVEPGVHSVYIDETEYEPDTYYPLLEIVTISLSQFLYPGTLYEMGESLSELKMEVRWTTGGPLFFTLLPDMQKYDKQSLIKKYAMLKSVLRSL